MYVCMYVRISASASCMPLSHCHTHSPYMTNQRMHNTQYIRVNHTHSYIHTHLLIMHTPTYIHTYILTHIHSHTYVHTCMHAYIHVYMHACLPTYLPTHLHTYIHTQTHPCAVYIHTLTRIYPSTYTRTSHGLARTVTHRHLSSISLHPLHHPNVIPNSHVAPGIGALQGQKCSAIFWLGANKPIEGGGGHSRQGRGTSEAQTKERQRHKQR